MSMIRRFILSGGIIFRWRGHHIGVASALIGEQKNSWSRRHPNHASPH